MLWSWQKCCLWECGCRGRVTVGTWPTLQGVVGKTIHSELTPRPLPSSPLPIPWPGAGTSIKDTSHLRPGLPVTQFTVTLALTTTCWCHCPPLWLVGCFRRVPNALQRAMWHTLTVWTCVSVWTGGCVNVTAPELQPMLFLSTLVEHTGRKRSEEEPFILD